MGLKIMINTLLDGFITPSLKNDSLNGWGMAVQSYKYDAEDNLVEIEATVVDNEKLKDLFAEFFKLLKDQNDPLLDLLKDEVTDETVKAFNKEFLREYLVDIITAVESNTRAKWLVFLMDSDNDDYLDVSFIYNFSMSSTVVDIGAITDYKNH